LGAVRPDPARTLIWRCRQVAPPGSRVWGRFFEVFATFQRKAAKKSALPKGLGFVCDH